VVGCWCGYLPGARCRLAYGPADATATHSLSLASVKSRLVLPFWYRLTWVLPEKGPLNGCVCVLEKLRILYYVSNGTNIATEIAVTETTSDDNALRRAVYSYGLHVFGNVSAIRPLD